MKIIKVDESSKEDYNKATQSINNYWKYINSKLRKQDNINQEYAAYLTFMFNKLWRKYSNV